MFEKWRFDLKINTLTSTKIIMIRIREPKVAGAFYPSDKKVLLEQINSLIKHKFGPKFIKEENFFGAIVPHAGYIYSGAVKAWVYSKIKKANYIILGPNHYGMGAQFAILKEGMWKTPLGEVLIDSKMAQKILNTCKLVEQDAIPHEHEHSIEVQLPFLQFRFDDEFKFVPISILHPYPSDDFLKKCIEVGKALASCIKASDSEWIILASSDFSHYISHRKATEIDMSLIKTIEKLNEESFFKKLIELNASVCGYGPIAVVMSCVKKLGAKKGKLLMYKTSGDITGDKSSVVGYASIIFV